MKNWLRLGLTEIKGNEIIRSESTGIGEAWGLPREKFISGMVWQYCLVIDLKYYQNQDASFFFTVVNLEYVFLVQ